MITMDDETTETLPTEVTAPETTAEATPAPLAAAEETLPTEVQPLKAPAEETTAPTPAVEEGMPTEVKPLEAPEPAPAMTWSEAEKDKYWQRVLTGDAATVPPEVQAKAGAEDPTAEPEEREYKLLSTINRSWVVDHSDKSREEVQQNWPAMRRELTAQLNAGDDEDELFAALSERSQLEPQLEQARAWYGESYEQALRGQETEEPQGNEPEARIRREALAEGRARRRELLPQADRVAAALSWLNDAEGGTMGDMLQLYGRVPELASVVHELAGQDEQQRAAVLAVAAGRAPERPNGDGKAPRKLLPALWDSFNRGRMNLNYGLIQGAGQLGVATLSSLGRANDSEGLKNAAAATDEHLRVLEQLRRVAQGEAYPIRLKPDASFAEELALEAAEATPSTALACSGGAGFGLLAFSGMGDAVAEARQRAPQGDQELQLAAGMVGSAVQTGIYMGLSRLGGRCLEKGLRSFAASHGAGKFALSALGAGGRVTGETAGMLLASKPAAAADLGLQELAARLDGTASNIDWRAFGDDMTSIEGNMREAARQLPYLLIGSGRVALHHFRNPEMVLGRSGEPLAEWGVPAESRRLLMAESDPHRRDTMLRDLLRGSKRWSGVGFLAEAAKVLRLLHTDDSQPFRDEESVRDFLQLPPETDAPTRVKVADVSDPEAAKAMAKDYLEGKTPGPAALPFLQLVDAWWNKAHPDGMENNPRYGDELVPHRLTRNGLFGPEIEAERRTALKELIDGAEQLSYRFLLNTHNFETLLYHGKDVVTTVRETEALRKHYLSKLAEAVLLRAGGATLPEMDVPFATFFNNYYRDSRQRTSMKSWQRYMQRPRMLGEVGFSALSPKPPMGPNQNPGFIQACHIVRATHAVAEALDMLLQNHPDFQTLISRGLSPQEAMAHLLDREMGERLPKNWVPANLQPDATDRERFTAENAEMMERYTRLLGVEPESRTGEDGRTYWRVMAPDGHYTHWHDAREHAVNDMVTNARLRFLQHGQMLSRNYRAAEKDGAFDATQFSVGREAETSYFDMLTSRATGDLVTLWQERPGFSEPGLTIGSQFGRVYSYAKLAAPVVHENPENPEHWLADELTVRTPFAVMQSRFHSFWRDAVTSGRITAQEMADFLVRRGVITPRRRQVLLRNMSVERYKRHPSCYKEQMSPEEYKEALKAWWKDNITSYVPSRNKELADHLTTLTSLYCLNHLQELPLPPSVREWFGLAALMRTPDVGWNTNSDKPYFGTRDNDYNRRKAHRHTVARLHEMMPQLDAMRTATSEGGDLAQDPFFRHIQAAIFPDEATRAERGWNFALDHGRGFHSRPAVFWDMVQDPAEAWSRLSPSQQERVADAMGFELPEEGVPERLSRLSNALREHPWLHRYDCLPQDGSELTELQLLPMDTLSHEDDEWGDYKGAGVMSGQYALQARDNLPEGTPPEAAEALTELATLRRGLLGLPYADSTGIWWNGVRYGGADGALPPEMAESENHWTPCEPLPTLRRLFSGDNAQQLPLTFAGIDLAKLPPLPEEPLRNITIYRAPEIDMAQVRLMPGHPDSSDPDVRNPYIIHTFTGASIRQGRITRNGDEHGVYFNPLEGFAGPDADYVGHMLPFLGRENLDNMLETFMQRTASREALANLRNNTFSNTELLMALAEDSRFDLAMAARAPHEYSEAETMAALMFHALASHEYGSEPEQAAEHLLSINRYFTEHPEKREAVKQMLEKKMLWQSNSSSPWTFNPTQVYPSKHIDHGYIRDPKPYHGPTYNTARRK